MAGLSRRVGHKEFEERDARASQGLPADWWLAHEVCTYLTRLRDRALKPSTWRGYVARGQAPQPDDTSIPGRNRWRPATIRAFELSRVGTGKTARRAAEWVKPNDSS